jgi:hypothetical protein
MHAGLANCYDLITTRSHWPASCSVPHFPALTSADFPLTPHASSLHPSILQDPVSLANACPTDTLTTSYHQPGSWCSRQTRLTLPDHNTFSKPPQSGQCPFPSPTSNAFQAGAASPSTVHRQLSQSPPDLRVEMTHTWTVACTRPGVTSHYCWENPKSTSSWKNDRGERDPGR